MTGKQTKWEDLREKLLAEDPELRAEYQRLGPRYEFITAVLGARAKRGWTQTDLAKACGTTQSAIARLESGDQDPKLSTMSAVCDALGLTMKIGKTNLNPSASSRRPA